jgi:hypothetical protein
VNAESESQTRRELFGMFAGIPLTYASSLFAADSKQSTARVARHLTALEKLLGIQVVVKDWQPIDISETVKGALNGRMWKFQETKGRYTNKNWSIQESFAAGNGASTKLDGRYGKLFLCSAQPQRAYTLNLGDTARGELWSPLVGTEWQRTDISENGIAAYGTYNHPNDNEQTVTVANIHTRKKIVFNVKASMSSPDLFGDFLLSGGGTRFLVPGKEHSYAVLDCSDHKIVDIRDGSGLKRFPFLISYDGTEVLLNEFQLCYTLRNLETKKERILCGQALSRVEWNTSRSGKYYACLRSEFGENSLEIYILQSGEGFSVGSFPTHYPLLKIEDDGTIFAGSGVYRYTKGNYRWEKNPWSPPEWTPPTITKFKF